MKRLAAAAILLLLAFPLFAEEGPFASSRSSAQSEATQAELDQLLAPIALYPDALLTDVLAASTYPLEVIALQRWLERNPGLAPEALESAVASQPWDPSVKALAPFRSVVAMMNGELEWMQRVGDAFLANGPEVMDAVQRLRRKAREAGNLADNERERVSVVDDAVVIEPAQPDVIYVPVYDPLVVYGPWWWPGYPPYVWTAGWFGPWDYVHGGLYFGAGIHVRNAWFDHRPDWRRRNVIVHRPGSPFEWRHDPLHRGGVPYANPRTRERFGGVDRDRVRGRESFRGFDVSPRTAPPRRAPAQLGSSRPSNQIARPSNQIARPSSQIARPSNQIARPQSPRGFSLAPRGNASQHAERGRQSLGAPTPAPAQRSREHR